MSLRTEIAESPAIVARLLRESRDGVEAVAAAIRARGADLAVVAARGTSDHAGIYGQYILGARNGILVAPATPSLVSLYGAPPRMGSALVLGISQSGRSPDVVSVVAASRRQGALTVAITNHPESELATAAEHVLPLRAGDERAVAATKTYVAELAVLAMLSAALSGDGRSQAELAALPAALAAALDGEPAAQAAASSWAGYDACTVLARGFNYATAREWALKLKEVAGVLADPYSTADFQHGPITLVGDGTPVLAVAAAGVAFDSVADLLGRLRDDGARVLALTDADALGAGIETVRVPAVPEWLSPIVAMIPAQLFALHLAGARGIDPEHPRHLSKVTLTR